KRFFTMAEPSETVIDRMVDSRDPARALTFIVQRLKSDDLRPIARASSSGVEAKTAEVAFAVDDESQGKGLSTALLERLAVLAARQGFEKFQASTPADHTQMLQVVTH